MPIYYSSKKRNRAIKLRSQGQSLRTIAKSLVISVSTAQIWTKEVQLSNKQKQVIATEHRNKLIKGRNEFIKCKKVQKLKRESKIFLDARSEIQQRKSDPFFILGLALYWAEGFKKDHSLGFVNSDSFMIETFFKWLTTYGEIRVENIRLRVQINEVYQPNILLIQKYWSDLLKVPLSQFQTPFFQTSKSKNNYIGSEYRGMLRIRVVESRNLFVKILGWLEGLKETDY